MSHLLHPLTFEPIFKSMLWGGRRLPEFLGRPAPHPDPIGEAWVLSDVDHSPTPIADGPLAGRTLRELIAEFPGQTLGPAATPDGRFPLLLKFIDARQELSVRSTRTTSRRPGCTAPASAARRRRGSSTTPTPPLAASTPGSAPG